jgi:hypothetical protein
VEIPTARWWSATTLRRASDDAHVHVYASARAVANAPIHINVAACVDANANVHAPAIVTVNVTADAHPARNPVNIPVTIHVQSYIAHPYWPERERLINVQKESGMNRARSAANRRKALEEYLRGEGLTLADYDALVVLADRQFYTDDDGLIIIPKKHVDGMLVAMCSTIRSASRPCPPDMVRTVLRASPWSTDIAETDAGWWERYAVVSSGTGARLSNQRALRRNAYIGDTPPSEVEPLKEIVARGSIDINPEMVRPETLEKALRWAGEWVGIGASRKMGWGRFDVVEFG